jgi:glycerol-3-phosphate acyltransferase PlsY
VVFAISPWLGLVGLGLWIVIIFITRYVSLASMIAILSVAFLIYIPQLAFLYLFNNNALFQGVNWSPNIVSQVILMLIMLCNSFISIGRHAPNINRLIHRKEKRFF